MLKNKKETSKKERNKPKKITTLGVLLPLAGYIYNKPYSPHPMADKS